MRKAEALMRRTGLTADEAIGLAGLSPLTPLEIYKRKVLNKSAPIAKDRTRAVAIRYEEQARMLLGKFPMFRNPVQRFALSAGGWVAHRKFAPQDRIVLLLRREALDPWAALPPDIEATAHWEMGATGYDRLDVAVLFGRPTRSSGVTIFPVEFNMSVFVRLYGFAEHFMAESVLQKVPPK